MLINRRTRMSKKTNRLQNKKENAEATLYLYDEIGGWWGVKAADFVKEIQAIDADVIHLRIDSPGGDVFAARAMQTALKQHKAKVIAHVDGLAASAASFLAMGCDEVEVVDGGFIMIHKALSMMDVFGYFNEDDLSKLCSEMEKERSLLIKVDDSIVSDYAKKSGKDSVEIRQKMVEETWFTAQEAVDFGLADRVYDGKPVANSFDLTVFMKTPDALLGRSEMVSKRDAERALCDAGCSQVLAKSILAKGWKEGIQRDVEPEKTDQAPEESQRDVDNSLVSEVDKTSALLMRADAIMAPTTPLQ